MKVKDYIYMAGLNTGSTTYEKDLVEYFKVDQSQTLEGVKEDLVKCMQINPKEIKGTHFWLNGKLYIIEKSILSGTYEQFSRLDVLLAEDNPEKDLNKLLAIYVRPFNWLRLRPKKFSLHTQEQIYTDLLELDMNVAQGLTLFFYSVVMKFSKNTSILYLNQMKEMSEITMDPIKNKLMD